MIDALYFDGRSARGQAVRLHLDGDTLVAAGASDQRWPLADVQWPERTRHGQRVLHLRDGGSLQALDPSAFDDWRRGSGVREAAVVRWQQNWRATLAAVLALLLVAAAGYRWGVPWAARGVVAFVPGHVDAAIGHALLADLPAGWLAPSALPPARQQSLRAAFTAAVAAAHPQRDLPPWELHFRRAHRSLGANAFALPGGSIVITDQLVDQLDGHDDTIVGVLAHEFGHVRQRHGMQALVQFGLLGAVTGIAFGDFSTVLAGAPALLGQAGYARDAEREADAESARVLVASGRSPAAMVVLFDKLQPQPGAGSALAIAFASHPMDAERRRYFRGGAD